MSVIVEPDSYAKNVPFTSAVVTLVTEVVSKDPVRVTCLVSVGIHRAVFHSVTEVVTVSPVVSLDFTTLENPRAPAPILCTRKSLYLYEIFCSAATPFDEVTPLTRF